MGRMRTIQLLTSGEIREEFCDCMLTAASFKRANKMQLIKS